VCLLGLLNWLWPESIGNDHVRGTLPLERLNWPLGYWNGMAAFAAMTFAGCLAFASHATSLLTRGLAAAALPVLPVVVYLTYSRGGVFFLAIAVVVTLTCAQHRLAALLQVAASAPFAATTILFIRGHEDLARGLGGEGAAVVMGLIGMGSAIGVGTAVTLRRRGLDQRMRLPRNLARGAAALGVACVAAATIFVAPVAVKRAQESFTAAEVAREDDPTARFANLGGGRDELFAAAIDSWKESRWRGTGPGTFEFTWNTDRRYAGFVRDAHSLYLEALAESGVVGFIAVLVFFGGLASALLLRLRRVAEEQFPAVLAGTGVLGVFLVAAAVEWAWELTALVALMLIVVGAAASTGGEGSRRPGRRVRLLAIPSVAAILVISAPTLGTSLVRESQAAVAAGDTRKALRLAGDAVELAPWAATPRVQRALVLEERGDLEGALESAEQATSREPANWRIHILIARLQARLGRTEAALAAYAQARKTAPYRLEFTR
jgi:hypothetical protein